MPLARKIGLRPLNSEKGANTIGAKANPTQKMVMERLATTVLIFHFSANVKLAGLTSPADKPASMVTVQEMYVIMLLRHFGHVKGEVYFSSLGPSGGDD